MKSCPACQREVEDAALECPFCGIIFARWRTRSERPTSGRPRPEIHPHAGRRPSGSPLKRVAVVLVLGLAGGLAVAGAYWYLKIYPRVAVVEDPYHGIRPTRGQRLEVEEDAVSDFDRTIQLPGDPLAMVWNGSELILANREDPWGFLRLTVDAQGRFRAQKVPVIETLYRQQIALTALTWNGTHYVGYTDGSWFQSSEPKVFTLHDPQSFRVIEIHPAPDGLGCLAWDGSGYWAASRKNTKASNEPAFLYRLTPSFEVTARATPPAVGCQGLAWDGAYLWLADVFSDSIFIIDPAGSSPRTIQTYSTRFDYLSGVGFDGRHIWIAEYGNDQLYRLNPRLQRAWVTRGGEELELGELRPLEPAEGGDESLESLRRRLRSGDWSERLQAEGELRSRGAPADYDRAPENLSADRGPEDTDVLEWEVELDGDVLYGSWHLYFGEALFGAAERAAVGPFSLPTFAKYTITVEGEGLARSIEREFEAEPGDNLRRRVELASDLPPGSYRVDLFIHVQYVDPEGQGRILNNSAFTLEVGR